MNTKKAIIFALVGILLVSSLGLAVEVASARMVDRNSVMGNSMISNRLTSATWQRVIGIAQQWGDVNVNGSLQVQARTAVHNETDSKALAQATAIWTTNLTRPIEGVRDRENFTYVYYVARLVNSSITSQTYENGVFTLTGTWKVANITANITVITNDDGYITRVIRTQDIKPDQATGTLTIADNKFTLALDNKDPLTGSVIRSVTRSWNNPFKMADDSTNTITRYDVHAIGQCNGAMPGWGNYNSNMDFNNNFRVDIADISTVAANVES